MEHYAKIIKESVQERHGSDGNVTNLTTHSFSRDNYKLKQQFNFISTYNVCINKSLTSNVLPVS